MRDRLFSVVARLQRAPAAVSAAESSPVSSRAKRGSIPPTVAIKTLLSLLKASSISAPAAASRAALTPSRTTVTRGMMPPARAMATCKHGSKDQALVLVQKDGGNKVSGNHLWRSEGTLFPSSTAKFQSALAEASCVRVGPDGAQRRATSGAMPPALAISFLLSFSTDRYLSRAVRYIL